MPFAGALPATADSPRVAPAFTLVEMIVVMGIIIVILLIAVPAIRTLTGSRSVDAAFNTVSAIIVRAREEAVGLQETRGVMFYIEPTTDRVNAVIVHSVPVLSGDQDQNGKNDPAAYYLDLVPNRDFLSLPPGIGVQVVNDAGQAGITDRYIGFNPISFATAPQTRFGGVILFDGNGRLISKTYGLKLVDSSSSAKPATQLAQMLGLSTATMDYTPGPGGANTFLFSQFGFVLYDREAFKAAGFTDGDTNLDPAVSTAYNQSTTTDENSEEVWLDANSTPILINRYNGTLIRAE